MYFLVIVVFLMFGLLMITGLFFVFFDSIWMYRRILLFFFMSGSSLLRLVSLVKLDLYLLSVLYFFLGFLFKMKEKKYN